jgi:hypothetical protein
MREVLEKLSSDSGGKTRASDYLQGIGRALDIARDSSTCHDRIRPDA